MTELEDFVIQSVRKMRLSQNISQQELADYMNVSQSFIRDCENPKRRAKYNLAHLNKLSKILHCDFKDFFPDKPFEHDD